MNAGDKQFKKSKDDQVLVFSETLKQILADFSQRAREITLNRFGVFSSHPMTLEEIGKKYNITRERVRQVIREVIRKVQEQKNDQAFSQIKEQVVLALRENGGIMKTSNLLEKLSKSDANEKAALSFFLQCLDGVIEQEIKGELLSAFVLPEFDLSKWRKVKDATIEILKTQKKPLLISELFELLKDELNEVDFSKEDLLHYLEVSQEIKQNTFGKWGIAKWKEISPKGTREKAYMVLKEAAAPLHFREIAKKIDKHNLNKRKTHAQTVHNELIKDGNFVLIGRGIYALVEWGYKSGTVKDVIEDILQKSEKMLNKDELLEKVLKIRQVKKTTVVINLNNYFVKSKTGHYLAKK